MPGRPLKVDRETARRMFEAKLAGITIGQVAFEFNINWRTANDAIKRYRDGGYDVEKQKENTTCKKLYSDKAPELDDTKLPRWSYMPPYTNIAVLSRRDSFHYRPE